MRFHRIIISRKLLREAMNLPDYVEITSIHYRPETGDWQIEVLGDVGELKTDVPVAEFGDVGKIFQKAVHEVPEDIPAEG